VNILIEKNIMVPVHDGVQLAYHDSAHPSHLVRPIIERD
jgi:hypothetical protein